MAEHCKCGALAIPYSGPAQCEAGGIERGMWSGGHARHFKKRSKVELSMFITDNNPVPWSSLARMPGE
jgi:hypothetical protein